MKSTISSMPRPMPPLLPRPMPPLLPRGRAALLGLSAFALLLAPIARAADGDTLWVRSFGGTSGDSIQGVAVDSGGNVVLGGEFRGVADFDPGPGVAELTPSSDLDGFVSKLDADGDFLWAFALSGDPDARAGVEDVAVDGDDNVYIAGLFRGVIDFDPGPDPFELDGGENDDFFVAKYTPGGALLWAHHTGDDSIVRVQSIAVDGSGNAYVFGQFNAGEGGLDFDPGLSEASVRGVAALDVFVVKYDTDGEFTWVRVIAGPGTPEVSDMTVDSAGNVYFTGEINSSLDLDPGPSELFVRPANPSTSNYDVYVVKLDTDGDLAWGHAFGNDEWDIVNGIGVDDDGNVVVVGNFEGTVDFDPGPEFFFFEAQGESDAYAVKYDANGDFVSARFTGGSNREPDDRVFVEGASVDREGNVLTYGAFDGTIDFDPSATGEMRLTAVPDSNFFGGNLFLQKLDSDGQLVWVKTATTQAFMDGTDLAFDSSGNVYFGGNYNFDAVFDPGADELAFEALGGTTDPFVWKIEGAAIPETSPADINNDGTVDAVDVQLVINGALGIAVPQGLTADINGDDEVNAVDVQLVINAALGIEVSP